MSKVKKYNMEELAIKGRKCSEKVRKLEKDLEHLQQMNRNIYNGNTFLKAELDRVTGYFMQAVAVLEDVADRLDILEGKDGFEWAGELKFDIERALILENKLNKPVVRGSYR